mgnify:CR=1 FL=1
MTRTSQLVRNSHCVYNLKYHLVLVTKYRRKCLNIQMINKLQAICTNVCSQWPSALLEFGAEHDHMHLLLDLNPNVTPSKFINNLKTITSRLLRRDFEQHLKKYYWKNVLWTRSYCLITAGGAPLSVLKQYIQNQQSTKT